MNSILTDSASVLRPLPLRLNAVPWCVMGSGPKARQQVKRLLQLCPRARVRLVAEDWDGGWEALRREEALQWEQQVPSAEALPAAGLVILETGNPVLDEVIAAAARSRGLAVCLPAQPQGSDFLFPETAIRKAERQSERAWQRLTSRLILGFLLMILGHVVISYLPLPSVPEIWTGVKEGLDGRFVFFVIAGFLAQLVDGMLSMGYGVTSATALMSFGVPPAAMSAAIHTSEIFTTGISGYSHYRFGNVNKKLFRHLVIPGVLGAVGGALLLVYLGEKWGKWLMPLMAVYAGFLGIRILIKAFAQPVKPRKAKRIGWLAGIGGFLDSFGGGGWGPIVTSTLIARGRSPKYTVGSVSLTEFFVTLASAFTFFLTVGISHLGIVLGLLIGGSLAAPIAARLAGRLPRKTMMVAVGIMVIIWCVRMILKSLF